MRFWVLLLSVFLFSCGHTIYVVRHAEKAIGIDPATMKTSPEIPRGALMDYGWMSHALMWIVGLMSVCAGVGAVAAMFSLGRDPSILSQFGCSKEGYYYGRATLFQEEYGNLHADPIVRDADAPTKFLNMFKTTYGI